MEEINIKTLLPVGEKLKPLLSKSCISEADLKGILAERGRSAAICRAKLVQLELEGYDVQG